MTWSEPTNKHPRLHLPLTNANPNKPLSECLINDTFSVNVSKTWLQSWHKPNHSSPELLCQNLIILLESLAELTILCQEKITIFSKNEPHDLVTDTDIGIELLLKFWFKTHLPNHKLIGEESQKPILKTNDICWYLDPIDGTANYAAKKNNYCINLGSTFNGKPYINIIYHPKTKSYHYQTPKTVSKILPPSDKKRLCSEFYPHKLKEKKIYETMLKKSQWQAYQTQALGVSLFEMMNGNCTAFYKANAKPWDILPGASILATSPFWEINFFTKDYQNVSLFSNHIDFITYLNNCFKTDCRIGTLIITPKNNPKIKKLIIETLAKP